MQQPAKQKKACPGKGIEEAFHPMRRCHIRHIGFNASGVAWVFGQLIEIGQMPAGAVCHKTKNLFEKFENGNSLFAFANRTEKSVNQRKYPDLVQVCNEQRQTAPAGQTVACHFNFADFQFLFSVNFAIVFHQVLHLVGMAVLVNAFGCFNKYYSILSQGVGLFFAKNRSI